MFKINFSNSFKKDLKLMQKRGYNMKKIYQTILDIQNQIPLPQKYRNHALVGQYSGFMECHIEPDWLLIYRISLENNTVYFVSTGTHSDLF
jgi:addiction module toxin component, yafQ family